jgi:aminopeptidase N
MNKIAFYLVFSFQLLFINSNVHAAKASISDSIDIIHTKASINITDFITKNIYAITDLKIKSKINGLQTTTFDLEGLTVDSVLINGVINPFVQTSNNVSTNLISMLNIGDSATITIHYHGVPIADATWGGFSFNGAYAYQMGVGFNAQPHSYGRTWLPCFDNFVERCSYEYFITTDTLAKAICNGILIDSTFQNNTITWHWKLVEEIPSYLASVAVNSFVKVSQNLSGINGTTPADVYCTLPQVNAVNGSFANLQQSFTSLENSFGAYSWPKAGYTLVPFTAGAMEHATNIHIGNAFIDGALTYETLIAHELSHHWWGDLVTCSTAGDMWLNEGFASYCEQLHTEKVYGKSAYDNAVKANHLDVLNRAHIYDSGYRAVANMDSNYTYGMTVYNKGSDMIHTLRSYLGDTLFFNSLTSFLNSHKFQSINTTLLKDYLSTYTGKNMEDFFNDWILQPGFGYFGIDSFTYQLNNGNYYTSINIRQRKHKNTNYYNNVPLEIGIYDAFMILHIKTINFTGRCLTYNVDLNFEPKMIVIDPNNKLSDAMTSDMKILKTISNTIFSQSKCRLQVKSIINTADSSFIQIDHNWVQPDRFKNIANANGYALASSRYWTIQGINLSNVSGIIQFSFDGTSSANFIDSSWIKNTDDSIRLFYRKNAAYEWTFANDSLVVGNLNDKRGSIYSKEIKAGEYCFGIKRSTYTDTLVTDMPTNCGIVSSIIDKNPESNNLLIYPNPATNFLTIKKPAGTFNKNIFLKLIDMQGKEFMLSISNINKNADFIEVKLPTISKGFYIIEIYETGKTFRSKLLIE